MAISDQFAPNRTDGDVKSVPVPGQVLAADGAITIASGTVMITKTGTVGDITIDDPPAGMDYATLTIVSTTALAHVVTYANGFNGTAEDTATWGAAAGNAMVLKAYNGVWYTVSLLNVTLSEA